MGNARHIAFFSGMGAGSDGRGGSGVRTRAGRDVASDAGRPDVAVYFVSAARGPGHRCDEKAGVDQPQPRKRFQGTSHGRGAAVTGAAAKAGDQEKSSLAACAAPDLGRSPRGGFKIVKNLDGGPERLGY